MNYEPIKKILESNFDFVTKNSLPWFIMANELMHAGFRLREISFKARKNIDTIMELDKGRRDIVVNDFKLYKQATMLIGFAIENALKGRIIEMGGVGYKKDIDNMVKKLPKYLEGHNLVSLAEKSRLELNDAEKCILKQFSESTIWSCRYPNPTSIENYTNYFYNKSTFILDNCTIDTLPPDIESVLRKIFNLNSNGI